MVIENIEVDPGSYLVPNGVSLGLVHVDHGQLGHLSGLKVDVVAGNLKLNLTLKRFVFNFGK